MTSPGKQRTVLILGAGLMQFPAFAAARQLGLRVVAADANPAAAAASQADQFHAIDIADQTALLALARSYADSTGLHGVFTCATDFSTSVAHVAEELGLPGIGYETALNASLKSRMRAKFKAAGVPSPEFVEIGPDQSAANLTVNLRYPLVVKPVDNMGARGVCKIDRPTDLAAAVQQARHYSRQGSVLVEEFIDGPEFSIDSLVIDGQVTPCGVADRHIYFPPYFVELGHTLPTDLPANRLKALLDVFSQAVAAIGLRNGVAKGDVFYSSRGPMIGEIAARLSGGYMSGWTYPLATGIDLTAIALRLALGERPAIPKPSRHWTAVERAIVSIPGLIGAIEGQAAARSITGVSEVFFRYKPGDTAVFPKNNVEKAGNVIAAAATKNLAIGAGQAAVAAIEPVLQADHPDTEAYLTSPYVPNDANDPGLSERAFPPAYPRLADWLYREAQIDPTAAADLPSRLLSELGVWDYRPLGAVLAGDWLPWSPPATPWWALTVVARGGQQALRYAIATINSLAPAEQVRRQKLWSLRP